MKRRIDGPGDLGRVLRPDDPLLKEAEPWADQATMRFYPDVWTGEGPSTPIPNLLVSLAFAKSWAARAASTPDAPAAIEDCRRASIRIGAEQLYALAARRGDQPLMLAAAIVQGEVAPQRLRTAELLTRVAIQAAKKDAVTDGKVDDLIGVAKTSPDRRFRNEAIVMLGFARFMGTSAQREKAESALAELKTSPDALVAGNARWALQLRHGDLKDLSGAIH